MSRKMKGGNRKIEVGGVDYSKRRPFRFRRKAKRLKLIPSGFRKLVKGYTKQAWFRRLNEAEKKRHFEAFTEGVAP